MEAWQDLTGGQVQDEWGQRGMKRGETEKHAQARQRTRLGNFISVSNVVVKDIYRATEDVGASEISMGATSL